MVNIMGLYMHAQAELAKRWRPMADVEFWLLGAAAWTKLWIRILGGSTNHKIFIYEKKDRELKKLWNMQVTIIPIIIGAFGTVTKWLLKELEDLEVGGRVETIQTTTLLRTARILRRVLETWAVSR